MVAGIVKIQQEPFDLQKEIDHVISASTDHKNHIGAVVNFIGYVRDDYDKNQGKSMQGLYLEHYPEMTEKQLLKMRQQAINRFNLTAATIIHRIGRLDICDPIVLVICASGHRLDAFEGCQFLMDWLKIDAPFWKAEIKADGTLVWLEQKESDRQRGELWCK